MEDHGWRNRGVAKRPMAAAPPADLSVFPIAIPPSNPNCALAAAAQGPTNLSEPGVEPTLLNRKSIGNTPLSKKRVQRSVTEHRAQIEIGLRTRAAQDPDTSRIVLRRYTGPRSI